MNRKEHTVLFIAAGLLFAAQVAAQTTRHVNPLHPNSQDSQNPCVNADIPCETIGHAIEVSDSGDIVDIATAIYTEILEIDKSISLQGSGEVGSIIQAHAQPGEATESVITIDGDIEVAIADLAVRNGGLSPVTGGNGGGIFYRHATLALTNVTISGSQAIAGGGMAGTSGSSTLTNVTISGNTSESIGGGMWLNSGSTTLMDVTFSGNASFSGGGLFKSNSSTSTLTNVTFSGNTAEGGGGGMIFGVNDSTTLTNVTFSDNTAELRGGGMNAFGGSPTLTNVTFSNNTAGHDGGGMNVGSSSPSLTDVTFSDNEAESGGGMSVGSGAPDLTNVHFSGNIASLAGGGLYSDEGSTPLLADVIFNGNQAGYRGGGMASEGGTPLLVNVTFRGNHARCLGMLCDTIERQGGGLWNRDGHPELVNVQFSGNLAVESDLTASFGGGFYNRDGSPRLTNVVFSGNRVIGPGAAGGGMFNFNDEPAIDAPVIRNSIFWNNQDDSGIGTASASIDTGGEAPESNISFSLIQGRTPPGEGNLDGIGSANDPKFLTMPEPESAPTTAGNLRLRPESPVIDAGNNVFISDVDTDLDGNPRIVNDVVDLGPYEFNGEVDSLIFRDRFEQ